MKVIQLMHHSIVWRRLLKPYSEMYTEGKVSAHTDEFHERVAKQILKQTKKYEIECWQPEKTLKKVVVEKEDGITYRMFPSIYLSWGREYTLSLLKELKMQSKKEDILIHVHEMHNHLAYLTSYLFKDVPIVVQHHSAWPPLFAFKESNHPFRFIYLFEHYAEKKVFKNIDYFFVLTKDEKEYISNLVGADKVEIQTMGVDFGRFKPMDQVKARKMLHLPSDKKIMIYVGVLGKSKGADVVLEVFQTLKRKYDVDLILIGNTSADPLYNRAKATGAKVLGKISEEMLNSYYSAADVYVFPYPPSSNIWGGIGVAPVESLACGTPIVSTTLKHFPLGEWNLVGEMPKNNSDIVNCIIKIFENPNKYERCRDIAKKCYDWGNIVRNTIEVYDELFDKYYNKSHHDHSKPK